MTSPVLPPGLPALPAPTVAAPAPLPLGLPGFAVAPPTPAPVAAAPAPSLLVSASTTRMVVEAPRVAKKGMLVAFGDPKSGKTTSLLETFQQSYAVTTDANGFALYETFLRTKNSEYIAAGYAPPKRMTVMDPFGLYVVENTCSIPVGIKPIMIGNVATMTPIPRLKVFEHLMTELFQTTEAHVLAGHPPPYPNLFLDEATDLWMAFEADVATGKGTTGDPYFGDKNPNSMSWYGWLQKWDVKELGLLKALTLRGVNVIIATHQKEPQPTDGKLGGPSFGTQKAMALLGGKADLLIQRFIEPSLTPGAPPKRVWRSFAQNNMISGVRGVPDGDAEKLKNSPLRDWWHYAGFTCI